MTLNGRIRSVWRAGLGAAMLVLFTTAAQAADLTVSAAASLTNAFRELAPLFEAKYPDTKVVFNFAASDALLQQIAKGAPVDVFASADQETMDKAQEQKLLVAGTRRNFVSNSLVMIVPSDSTLNLKGLPDLQAAGVKRIAIGNPGGVPAGRYAKSALEGAKVWSAVESKAVFATSVRQALDYVARGEADAGFVYATDAAVFKDKVKVVATIPPDTPILYPLASINGGPNTTAANRFVEFLGHDAAAQAVLAKYGFGKP